MIRLRGSLGLIGSVELLRKCCCCRCRPVTHADKRETHESEKRVPSHTPLPVPGCIQREVWTHWIKLVRRRKASVLRGTTLQARIAFRQYKPSNEAHASQRQHHAIHVLRVQRVLLGKRRQQPLHLGEWKDLNEPSLPDVSDRKTKGRERVVPKEGRPNLSCAGGAATPAFRRVASSHTSVSSL
jgi:hypothetical protein